MQGCRLFPTLLGIAVVVAAPAGAAPVTTALAEQDLTQLSLQELLDVQVTSVSKRAEPLRHAAAAVTVIAGEELRRTGSRTIAQALRLVPGIQVARTNAHSYTVTARGFSGDKLEVLLDGRSVYSPLTSTVFWDVLDTFLADIDRIEVIRGPGATLWGANAVNGVINIVTRHPKDTLGNTLHAAAGIEERVGAAFRGGSKLGEGDYARFYAKAVERDPSVQDNGVDSFDRQRLALAGFRSDWALARGHDLTVSGDFHNGSTQTEDIRTNVYARADDATMRGANLLARWTYQVSRDSELSVQGYYDGYYRNLPTVFEEKRDTGDVQAQYRFLLERWATTVTAGAGYRVSHDETGGPPRAIIFEPASRTRGIHSAFIQGQREFDVAQVTFGTKLERNESTGLELQPSLRVGRNVNNNLFTWASVSRAVRLPNRIDEDVAIFCTPALAGILGCTPGTRARIGSRDIEVEQLLAYEYGLRAWIGDDFALDLTTFYNQYADLRTTETSPPPIGSFANKLDATSYGGELALGWTPAAGVSLRPFYAYLYIDAEPHADSTDTSTPANLEAASPRHSAGLHLALNPWPDLTIDGFVRHVDELERQRVPAYTELNFRIGWRPLPALELALVGADLLDDSHPEAGPVPTATNPDPAMFELERAVWLDVQWHWR